ncbi:hypothetical protein QQF64_035795 [Cirrhinus molitorella]|uniref:Uncharacterized protein n=1 Tax=Cirrhinus molitorella TaxID=172907 RepID=A0ABR3NH33_9TELE
MLRELSIPWEESQCRESKLQSQAKLVMDFDDGLEPVIPAVVGRKRKASKENHQREKTKQARHSGEGKHPKINCGHRASNVGLCHADKLPDEDVAQGSSIGGP